MKTFIVQKDIVKLYIGILKYKMRPNLKKGVVFYTIRLRDKNMWKGDGFDWCKPIMLGNVFY